jgi:hypothetical protein
MICRFKKGEGVQIDELKFEMIDFGLEEIGEDVEENVMICNPCNKHEVISADEQT